MKMRTLVLGTMMLSGCAGNPMTPEVLSYAPPATGPTAKLVVRVDQGAGRYVVSSFDQPVACSRRRQFVSAAGRDPGRHEFVLAANRLQTLSFLHVRDDKQACEVILSFEPRNASTYLMRNTATAKGCTVELFNSTNADAATIERTLIRRERVGMGSRDSACRPLTSTVQPRNPPAGSQRPDYLEPFVDLLPGK